MKKLSELFNEARASKENELYFDSYADAMTFAYNHAQKEGYEIDEDSWFTNVSVGPRKPGKNKTNIIHVDLLKNNKVSRKKLHVQVYNRDMATKPYELNKYIS